MAKSLMLYRSGFSLVVYPVIFLPFEVLLSYGIISSFDSANTCPILVLFVLE